MLKFNIPDQIKSKHNNYYFKKNKSYLECKKCIE